MDILTLVREGNADAVSTFLSGIGITQTGQDENEQASQVRKEAFGQSSWSAGMTSLLWAVEASNIAVAAVLLKYYPDLINTGDSQQTSPLHYAALNGDLEMAKFLIQRGSSTSAVDEMGETALHLACLNGHCEVVKHLLELGANPNHQSTSGATPLHHSVANSQLKVVSLLLAHPGIDLSLKDSGGTTAQQLAAQKGNKTLLDCFEPEKRAQIDHTAQMNATILAHETKIKELESLCLQDESSFASAKLKLQNQSNKVKALSLKVDQLQDKLADTTIRTDESYEIEYREVVDKLNKQRSINLDMEQQIQELERQNSRSRNIVTQTVLEAHQSLSNLMTLMDTANVAFVNIKTEIEMIKPHLYTKNEPF